MSLSLWNLNAYFTLTAQLILIVKFSLGRVDFFIDQKKHLLILKIINTLLAIMIYLRFNIILIVWIKYSDKHILMLH